MAKKITKSVAFFITPLLAACSNSPAYHQYWIKGKVITVENNQVVLCVGDRVGAKP